MNSQPNCHAIVSEYIAHLASDFEVEPYNEKGCHVITPFLRPDGDIIEFFVLQESDGTVRLSDEGQTFDWLFLAGAEVETSESRQSIAEGFAAQYGISLEGGIFSLELDPSRIYFGVHRFITALTSVQHIILTRRPKARLTFRDEVENYLIDNQVDHETFFTVLGRTMEHRIDFYLNSNRNMLIETLSANDFSSARERVVKVAFEWIDIREGGWDYQRVSLVDDTEDKWDRLWSDERISRSLQNYSDSIIPWSQRVRLLGPLSPKQRA